MTAIPAAAARALGQRLAGLPVTKAALGYGSFVTIDFGKQVRTALGQDQGEVYLWVFNGAWTLTSATGVVTSDDSREAMAESAATLTGLTVVEAWIDERTTALRVDFGGGITLDVPPRLDPELDDWLAYLDGTSVLVAAQGELTLGPSHSS